MKLLEVSICSQHFRMGVALSLIEERSTFGRKWRAWDCDFKMRSCRYVHILNSSTRLHPSNNSLVPRARVPRKACCYSTMGRSSLVYFSSTIPSSATHSEQIWVQNFGSISICVILAFIKSGQKQPSRQIFLFLFPLLRAALPYWALHFSMPMSLSISFLQYMCELFYRDVCVPTLVFEDFI